MQLTTTLVIAAPNSSRPVEVLNLDLVANAQVLDGLGGLGVLRHDVPPNESPRSLAGTSANDAAKAGQDYLALGRTASDSMMDILRVAKEGAS